MKKLSAFIFVFLGFLLFPVAAFATQPFTASNISFDQSTGTLQFDLTNLPSGFDTTSHIANTGETVEIWGMPNFYGRMYYSDTDFSSYNCNNFTHCQIHLTWQSQDVAPATPYSIVIFNNSGDTYLYSQDINSPDLPRPVLTPTPTPTETPTPTPAPQYNLTGNVYVDANSNGVKDTGENNYQGATVTLSQDTINLSGTSQQTATTDANGNYSFTGVPSGNYWMSLAVPTGYTGTTKALVNVVLNDNTTENFGIAQQPSAPTAFSDDFTDADGTLLATHNNNWVVFDGTSPVIQSNMLYIQDGDNWGLPNINLADQCASYDFKYPSVGAIYQRVRRGPGGVSNPAAYGTYINQNGSNFYDFALFWGANNYFGGGFTFPRSALSTGLHNLKLCAIGTQITAYLDSSVLATATDSRFSQGTTDFAASPGNYIDNFKLTTTNRPPSVGAITVSPNPVQVNTSTTASASFTDPDTADTHNNSGTFWNWGDGNTTTGTVTESNGSGSVSDSHTYSVAGVYTVTLKVTDSAGASNTSTFQYVSVYNPTSQGLFSAGHSFNSPAGAYPQNSSLTGNVTFGLSYKYQGTVPTSNREFIMNFKAANNFTFNATTISSLVVANSMATLTGTGTINGSGTYNFLVTGVDGADIRIQITDSSNNVIYDTQPGAAATATPTTSVNGQVIAHN